MKTFVYTDECPADAIRAYIEEIIELRRKKQEQQKSIPENLSIPSVIQISPKNLEFMLTSKLTHINGVSIDGTEVCVYWEVEPYPPLEVKVKKEEDNNFYLTYIREEASETKGAFEWNLNSEDEEENMLIIARKSDILEDIVDANEPLGKYIVKDMTEKSK